MPAGSQLRHNGSAVVRSTLFSLAIAAACFADDRQAVSTRLKQEPRKLPASFSWPPGIEASTELAPSDAVAVALWNNTALEADLAALGIAKADVLDARFLRNPSLWSLLPVAGKPFEVLLNWPIEEWWQRNRRVQAAQRNLDAIAKGLEQNGLNLIRDVRLAHADLRLAAVRVTILRESAQLRRRIAELAAKRRDAGDGTGLEVSLASADARSVEEQAVRAEGDVETAATRLRLLLGMRGDPQPLSAKAAATDALVPEQAALVEAGLTARPDLRAAELAVEAAAARAKWQRSRLLGLVNLILSVKPVGTPVKTRVGPGVQGEIPIFNRNQGQIARADAEVHQAGWRYAALRDRVEQEVREGRERLLQARQSLEKLRTEVRPAVERVLAQTEKAYSNGDLSYLNVLEASRQRFDILLREADADAAVDRARAELARACGGGL